MNACVVLIYILNMKSNSSKFEQLYDQELALLLTVEKKYLKYFEKLSAAAYTDELKTGLSISSTGLDQHLKRLKECSGKIKILNSLIVKPVDEALLKTAAGLLQSRKKPSITKDMEILNCSQTVLQVKISNYQVLQLMGAALGREHDVILMEQCVRDNQNNYSYLLQISGNIIYPEAIAEAIS